MTLDLVAKTFGIFGPRGGGKSNLLQYFLSLQPNHLVFDPLAEHEAFHRYVPDDPDSKDELAYLVDQGVINGGLKMRPRLFAIDEGNRTIEPHPKPMPRPVRNLNDYCRHWKITFGIVARRPVQVHVDMTELADATFLFRLTGRNDRRFCDNQISGLGKIVAELPDYHFCVLLPGGKFYIHDPVPDMTNYGKKGAKAGAK